MHQYLTDIGTGDLQHTLNLLRRNVLAARGLDQVLLTVSDPQITLLVKLPNVAGGEPAVGDCLRGRIWQVVVAVHHTWPLDQDLAVIGDLDLRARDRRPHGPEASGTRIVHAGRSAGLGKAVALQYQQSGRVEPLLHLTIRRCRSGHEEPDLATHPGFDLAEDKAIRERVLDSQQSRRLLARQLQR